MGSGGFLPTPLIGCSCELCKEARINPLLKRTGPSILIDDNLLIDTPEEISFQLEKVGVIPDFVLYSHWHPDHTNGCRIFEFFHYSCPEKIIKVIIPKSQIRFFKDYVKPVFYYESLGYIQIIDLSGTLTINGKTIIEVPLANGFASAYIIKDNKNASNARQSNTRQILVCMDHSKDLPIDKINSKLDLMILNLGSFDLADNSITTFEDNLRIIKTVNPAKTILLHIEEKFKKSHKDYKQIEIEYSKMNLLFAYDLMELEI
jgi:phosphoribosyl 1,2-cyclic phosphate phosphodiesterase